MTTHTIRGQRAWAACRNVISARVSSWEASVTKIMASARLRTPRTTLPSADSRPPTPGLSTKHRPVRRSIWRSRRTSTARTSPGGTDPLTDSPRT